jgi:hypothetical protein
MRTAAGIVVSSPSGDRNDGHQSIVAELASLIEQVQAGIKLLEAAIATESAPGNQESAGNIFVLDDVTPRYIKANAALNACNADLDAALHYLLDATSSRHGTGEVVTSDHRPARLNRA